MSIPTATQDSATAAPAKPPVELVDVQIDGQWLQFPKGTRLIEACQQAQKYIPRYCYHPKLSSPGNCRMCLIEMGMPKMGTDRKPELGPDGKPVINWIPRPQISCAQDVAEGMAVRTDSPMVQECRKGVMEFLLINHPLDCPICDQAGECRLQEFSIEYGNARSRFLDEKVKKPKHVDLGPRIVLDDERCILCSRCIRFTKEIAHDDALGFVDRGSHSTLSAHPGRPFDNNYTLNTVDICPVGALTSKDFRFKMRVWFLKDTKSICTSCGTGCNTVIGSRENVVYRQTPRENNEVNSSWMCDAGRLNIHYLNAAARLKQPWVRDASGQLLPATWRQALATAVAQLQAVKNSGGQLMMIASARMTNEEMFLARQLASALAPNLLDIKARPQQADGILVCDDGNPNTAGAKLFRLTRENAGSHLPIIVDAVNAGKVQGLICLGEDPGECGIHEGALRAMPCAISLGLTKTAVISASSVILPGAGFAEKRGSMINVRGRLQRLNTATATPGEARDDWEILRDLLLGLTGTNGLYAIEDLFRAMAAETPQFRGLSLSKVGDLGVPFPVASESGQAPPHTPLESATAAPPTK